MKKFLSLSLVLAMVLVSISAVASADTKTGLGIVTSIASSKDVSEKDGEKVDGRAQVDSTICAVTIDENGVILAVSFDVAQTRVAFDAEGKVKADLAAPVASKVELGEGYGMKGASAIGKELFEQVAALEAFCIGKTVEEVTSMPTYERDANHTRVSDLEDLKTSCTIDVGSYLDALTKAAANAK